MIELRQVCKRFGSSVAVRDISLTVARGELVALLGGSGSGKTTTLKMVNRLIEPSAGEVWVQGQPVHAQPAHVLRRSIGYCFQRIGLFPQMTVAQNIGITPNLLGWSPTRVQARVAELLELVELDPAMASRLPRELSGGEQQRVGVARALAAAPEVVLFDEPFGALDPITRDRLQDSLAAIRRRVGFTGIFVTHDLVEAFLLADRVAVMHQGVLIQVDTAQRLLRHPANDYVAQLINTPARQSARVQALLAQRGDAS